MDKELGMYPISIETMEYFPFSYEIREPSLIVAGRRQGKTTFIECLAGYLITQGRKPGIITTSLETAKILKETSLKHAPKNSFYVHSVSERGEFRYVDDILIDELTYIREPVGNGWDLNIKPKILAATTSTLDLEKIIWMPEYFNKEANLFKRVYIVNNSGG
jgi:hypothetical protein